MLQRLFSPLVIGSLALLVLSGLAWWLLPLVEIRGEHSFDGVWSRVVLVGALWLVWVGFLAWRAWRRARTNARLIEGLAGGPSASDREAQVLNQRFAEAITKLRSSGQKSWLEPKSYLYELPWYVFVGAPGSGKTTALLNAGLQFLLDEGKAGAVVKGVGGTRNCDWWFTRDAVLIDTAGRYATQESDEATDASAWRNFLALLKQTRPRQPINGIILTVSVQELLQQNTGERSALAAKLRARLAELESQLGVRAPVYVLVTKADLIAGFFESFGELGKEDRDQVWGFSFELAAPVASSDPLAQFDASYQDLEKRLGEGLPDRLAAERDVTRRAAQFGFVQEFAMLREPLHDFLAKVFSGGSATQASPLVRGVYFTSGTQEGTPIDRAMGALSRSFGLTRTGATQTVGKGRSFFLSALLHKVIFVERGLVSINAAAERRQRVLRLSAIAAMGVAAIALLAGWLVSYSRNAGYAADIAARLPDLNRQVAAIPPAPAGDVTLLAKPLAAVRDAATTSGFTVDSPPLANTFGLYQGNKLDSAAQLSYRRLLEHALMPRVARRLEERLRSASRDNLEATYLALKTYLMLYSPDTFRKSTLENWIAIDWNAQYGTTLSPEQRALLDRQLSALLDDGAPRPVSPMDQALVASVRDMLGSFPLEQRVYSQLKRKLQSIDVPEFTVSRAAGPNAAQVFTRSSREPLTRGIPGLYTREGYQRVFQQSLPDEAAQLAAEEAWVLGLRPTAQRPLDSAANAALTDKVRRLYLQDYVATWDKYLADVTLVKQDSLARSIEVARLLGGADSPLSAFQRAAATETTLAPAATVPSKLDAAVSAAAAKLKASRDEMEKLAGGQPSVSGAAAGQPVELIVDNHFAKLHRLFQGQPAPIEEQQKLFNDVFVQLTAIDAAQKSKSPPPAGGGGAALIAAAGQQPEAVRAMVETLVKAGAKQSRAAETDVMTAELKPITDFCQRSIANRYPFADTRADVLPDDFGQMFGPGGMLDDFYQRRLAALVDTGKANWAYKPLADGSQPASSAALAEFQRASKIKEAYFRSGGKSPGFKLDIRAVEFGDGLKELTIDIDGQAYKFVAGGNSVATVGWPSPRVSSELKVATLPAGAPLSFTGPWALFRLFERFDVQPSAQPEKFTVLLNLEGRKAKLEVTANSVLNPFRLREVRQFRCPGAL